MCLRYVTSTAGTHDQKAVTEAAASIAHEAVAVERGTVGADVWPVATPELLSRPRREGHQPKRQRDYEFVVSLRGHDERRGPGAGDLRELRGCALIDVRVRAAQRLRVDGG